jgi:DNA-binding NtrC family response regulator
VAARLLIVEDEDTLCASLQRVLRKEGYAVDIAGSAEDALEMLHRAAYDLIICDIILPGISGIELLQRYRAINPAQKVVIMTAYASMDTAKQALAAGASEFVLKPLTHDELKAVVRKVLEQ